MAGYYPRFRELSAAQLKHALIAFLDEDIRASDVTADNTLNKIVKAEIISNSSGVLSGLSEIKCLFGVYDISMTSDYKDGSKIRRGDIICQLLGNSRNILTTERIALNIMSKMSGISTLTERFVKKVTAVDSRVKISATRKTTPGFRYFEKKACVVGGAIAHRMGLYDMALVKDNHIAIVGSVEEAVSVVRAGFDGCVEAEVSSLESARQAINAGANIVMLDNLLPNQIKKIIKTLEQDGLRKKVKIEASGGVNLENISQYAKSGADVISVGAITHSAPALDFSLKITQ